MEFRPGTRVQFIEDWRESDDPDDYNPVPMLSTEVGTIIAVENGQDADGYYRTEKVTVRWDSGRLEDYPLNADDETKPELHDLQDVTPRLYVNVYLMNKFHYSSAEGGCWADCYDPEHDECVLCSSLEEVERVMKEKQAWCDEENKHRRSDISSVISEGRYVVYQQAWPAEPEPKQKPHYC